MSAEELRQLMVEACAPLKEGKATLVPVKLILMKDKIAITAEWGQKRKMVPMHVPPAILKRPGVMKEMLLAGRKVLAQEMGLEA
jgi:hypothetical protein